MPYIPPRFTFPSQGPQAPRRLRPHSGISRRNIGPRQSYNAPSPPPPPPPPPTGLYDLSGIVYLGAALAPAGSAFGGYAAGVDEPTGDLWLAGFDKEPNNPIARIRVSDLGIAANPASLPVATIVTPWFNPLTPEQRPGDHFTIHGLLPYGDRVIGVGLTQYDNSPFNQVGSHWFLQGSQQQAQGLYMLEVSPNDSIPIFTSNGTLVNATSGYVGGYLASVPESWQATFGKVICGNSTRSIVIRRSTGPAAFGFDPDDLGVTVPAPAKSMLYYPSDGTSWPSAGAKQYHPNTAEHPHGWLRAETATGAAFLDNAVVFAGSRGLGQVWYQSMPSGATQPCPPHGCEGFLQRLLAYDPADLAQVVTGAVKPWEPRPYAERALDDHPLLADLCKYITAAAFDRTRRLLYLVQAEGYAAPSTRIPVIHVYEVP